MQVPGFLISCVNALKKRVVDAFPMGFWWSLEPARAKWACCLCWSYVTLYQQDRAIHNSTDAIQSTELTAVLSDIPLFSPPPSDEADSWDNDELLIPEVPCYQLNLPFDYIYMVDSLEKLQWCETHLVQVSIWG